MKTFIPVLFVVLIAVRVQGHLWEQFRDCGDKLGVSLDDVQKLFNGDFSDGGIPENIMCVPQCFLENIGFLKDGTVDLDAIVQKVGHHFPDDKIDEFKSVVDKCKGESGDLKCETPFRMFNCFMGHMIMFKPDHDHKHGGE